MNKKNDRIAKRILLSAVDELENGTETVIKKVNLKGTFKIALVGGVFKIIAICDFPNKEA